MVRSQSIALCECCWPSEMAPKLQDGDRIQVVPREDWTPELRKAAMEARYMFRCQFPDQAPDILSSSEEESDEELQAHKESLKEWTEYLLKWQHAGEPRGWIPGVARPKSLFPWKRSGYPIPDPKQERGSTTSSSGPASAMEQVHQESLSHPDTSTQLKRKQPNSS